MKGNLKKQRGGEYTAPIVEPLCIVCEAGFAASSFDGSSSAFDNQPGQWNNQ